MKYVKLCLSSFLFVVLVGSFVVLPVANAASSSSNEGWHAKTSMLQARGGLGVVVVDGKIYAIGGRTVEGFVGINECYDPVSDTWVILEGMPTSRAYFGIVAYEGKIYCIGGINNGGLCAVTEVYDTATNSWSTRASLPVKGKNLQGQVVAEQIFVLDGCTLFVYDPVGDGWAKKSSIPFSVVDSVFVASAVVDNTIIVTGNFKFSNPSRTDMRVMIYDVTLDVWSEGKKPPTEFSQGVSVATTGVCASKKVYTLGTITTQEEWYDPSVNKLASPPAYVTSIRFFVEVYDPLSNVWSKAKVGMNRVDFGVAVVDDVLYIIGGYQVVSKETTVTLYVEEPDPTVYFGLKSVPKQFYTSEYAIGEPTAFTLQYVPTGYTGAPTVTAISPSNQIPNSLSGNLTITVVALLLIGGIVTSASLLIYFQKKKNSKLQ